MKTAARMTRSLVSFFFVAGMTSADPLTWDFVNAHFNDGGSLSGFFLFNAITDTATNWDISSTAGTALAAFEYTPSDSFFTDINGGTEFAFTSNATFPGCCGFLEHRGLVLTFVSPLTDAGGLVPLNLAATGVDEPRECLDCDPFRLFNADSAVLATPEPASLPLLGSVIGLAILAGAAQRRAQRKLS